MCIIMRAADGVAFVCSPTTCVTVGMKMEGLFRVPGPAAYTDELRKGFEEGI